MEFPEIIEKICGDVAPWLWEGAEVLCSVPKDEPHAYHGGCGWSWPNKNYVKKVDDGMENPSPVRM